LKSEELKQAAEFFRGASPDHNFYLGMASYMVELEGWKVTPWWRRKLQGKPTFRRREYSFDILSHKLSRKKWEYSQWPGPK